MIFLWCYNLNMLYSINWPGYCHMLQLPPLSHLKGDITYSMVKEEGQNCERIFFNCTLHSGLRCRHGVRV